MCNSRVDELDKEKTFARKAIKLTANSEPTSKSKIDPVSREDRADPWYFIHT